jgi:hypothetical protein
MSIQEIRNEPGEFTLDEVLALGLYDWQSEPYEDILAAEEDWEIEQWFNATF